MSEDRAAQIVRFARQLERERADARATVQRLMDRTALAQQWELPVPVAWRTIGFVQELTAASAAMQREDFAHAESLARMAIVVFGEIPVDDYPEVTRGTVEAAAWKELATAHRLQSKYMAAMRALDAAERCLTSPAQFLDRAVVKFARALVFSDQHQFPPAKALLQEVIQVFAAYDDAARVGQCLVLEGMIQYREGRLQDACVTYRRAINWLRGETDLHTLAAAHNNLAYALIDLGDIEAASAALRRASAVFQDLGLRPSVARARAALGKISLVTRKYDVARDLLSEVRLIFLGLHMPEEAGLFGLYLAEAWLGLGKPDRAQRIVEEVAREFAHAGLMERCRAALVWLSEKIPTAHGVAAVRHVTSYVEQVRREPQRVFVPLPEER